MLEVSNFSGSFGYVVTSKQWGGKILKINKQGGRNFCEGGKFLKNNKQDP